MVSKPPLPSGTFSRMFLGYTLGQPPGSIWDGIWGFSPERPRLLLVEMGGPKLVLFSTFCKSSSCPRTWQA